MPSDTSTPWRHGRDLTGRVHTLAVGAVAPLGDGGIELPSAIRKSAVSGPVMLGSMGLAGDEQADIAVQGVSDKAVFVYPWEHYSYWAEEFDLVLEEPAFGENISSVVLLETDVYVGDIFEWGEATVQVSQPRRRGFKIGACQLRELPVEVPRTSRTGFYLRVLRSGRVSSDDLLILRDVDPFGLAVADVTTVMTDGPAAAGLSPARVMLAAHLLPPRWVAKLGRLAPGQAFELDTARLDGTAG
jgi:MOSC domain-containing protein YiiM